MYSSPDEGAPAEAEGALCASGREYDANGHYIHGPRLVRPPIVRLIADVDVPPPGALTPAVARAQMRERKRRAQRSLANVRRFQLGLVGRRPPVRTSARAA